MQGLSEVWGLAPGLHTIRHVLQPCIQGILPTPTHTRLSLTVHNRAYTHPNIQCHAIGIRPLPCGGPTSLIVNPELRIAVGQVFFEKYNVDRFFIAIQAGETQP